MTTNDEMGVILEEAVVAYLRFYPDTCLKGWKNHKKPQSQ
jgi:hypothetical protein